MVKNNEPENIPVEEGESYIQNKNIYIYIPKIRRRISGLKHGHNGNT